MPGESVAPAVTSIYCNNIAFCYMYKGHLESPASVFIAHQIVICIFYSFQQSLSC